MFKVGDVVQVKPTTSYARHKTWMGPMSVTKVSLPYYICQHPSIGSATFSEQDLELVPTSVPVLGHPMTDGHPLNPGDIVQFVAIGMADQFFTPGKEYVIRADQGSQPPDRLCIVADDKGSSNGWVRRYFSFVRRGDASNVVIQTGGQIQPRQGHSAPMGMIPAHDCAQNVAHYDSGWSAFDYCRICDKKFQS